MENRELIAEAAESSGLPVETINQIVDGLTAKFEGVARSSNAGAVASLEGAEVLTGQSGSIVAEVASVPQNLGRSFIESAGYKAVQENGPRTPFNVEIAATLTSNDFIAPQVVPGIQYLRFRQLRIADLMPQGNTNSNTVRVLTETTFTNAAAEVSEGSAKPESTLAGGVVDEPVRKIAHVLKIAEEMLEDFEQTQAWVNNRMVFGLLLREDQQLYNGNGTAPNLSGILDRANLQTQVVGSETYFKDYIGVMKAKAKIRDYFWNPDGLVIAPNDWLQAQLEADANGQFAGGGPFRGQYGVGTGPLEEGPYAGLRVVVTSAATEGTALVGDFAQASMIWRRKGVTVQSTDSNEDDFINNLVSVRAEMREALEIRSGYAFCTVTNIT